jgi:hypothetical protein
MAFRVPQTTSSRQSLNECNGDVSTTAKQPSTVLDFAGNTSPTRIPFPELNGPKEYN